MGNFASQINRSTDMLLGANGVEQDVRAGLALRQYLYKELKDALRTPTLYGCPMVVHLAIGHQFMTDMETR